MTKEELLNEAKRRYPIGTTIKYLDNQVGIIAGHYFSVFKNGNVTASSSYNTQILYKDGLWAETISTSIEVIEIW